MHRYRKAFVWALLIGCSSSAAAQEKREPAGEISLGQPTPLAGGVLRAAFTQAAMDADIHKASYAPAPRPRIVRGALPSLDDQPRDAEPKPLPPIFPLMSSSKEISGTIQTLAQPEQKDKPKIIEVDKDGKVTVIPDPPSFQPLTAKTPPMVFQEAMPHYENDVIVDASETSLWGGAARRHGFMPRASFFTGGPAACTCRP